MKLAETQAVMNYDVLSLDEGYALFWWPSKISQESYEDLRDWLELMGRKIERMACTENKKGGAD